MNGSETIYALAAGPQSFGYTPSPVVGGYYTIPAVPKPTIAPSGGTYTYGTAATITLSDTMSGSTIYYTKDGTTPTTSSTLYTAPIPVTTATIKAIAANNGYASSAVAGPAYFTVKLAAPTFTTANGGQYPGTYTGSATVVLTDSDATATICYTTNGTTPTALTAGTCSNGTAASGSITLNPGVYTVKAIATASGYTNSIVTNGTYTVR